MFGVSRRITAQSREQTPLFLPKIYGHVVFSVITHDEMYVSWLGHFVPFYSFPASLRLELNFRQLVLAVEFFLQMFSFIELELVKVISQNL